MQRTDVVVIGAGQAGLAISHELAASGIDHVLLERGRVAERWRTTTWDSLRLVTPNWMTRLPGWRYRGNDPDGFMERDAIVRFLDAYAGATAAPVVDDSLVSSVQFAGRQYRVTATRGTWEARAVVFATGHCDVPYRPPSADAMAMSITQLHSSEYRNPASLPVGNILVVGASSSGSQIALELALAGRSVSIAVGRHTPVPEASLGAMCSGGSTGWGGSKNGPTASPTSRPSAASLRCSSPAALMAEAPTLPACKRQGYASWGGS